MGPAGLGRRRGPSQLTTPAVPDALRAALAGRYQLHRELGKGGMATVYLAADQKHHRDVALKALRPDLAASLGADRFLKEIEIAARLNHPHILTLHDSGTTEGFLWYVMPYVDGGSLRGRLTSEGRLAPDAALAIAERIADALTYAHRMGVVHRDIKPENILFSQGHPIVADFGIAKAVSTAGGANITRTGFPLGTPGYMSPEQAAGVTNLDERTDVYALGVVAYEMLVGELPGGWPTEDAVRAGRFGDVPGAHRAVLDGLPRHVEAAIVHALAVRLDQRTPSPAGFLGELARPGVRKVYSDTQVKDIVRRAAEAEAVAPTEGGAMTIGGVERLAAEVGIAPERVREAAQRATKGGEAPAPEISMGSPTRIVVDRVVPGVVPDDDVAVLVDEVRRWVGNAGKVDSMPRSVSWSANRTAMSGRDIHLTISTRGGQTHITLHEGLEGAASEAFARYGLGMGLGGTVILGGAIGAMSAPFLLPLIPAWLTGSWFVGKRAFHNKHQRKRAELERLADRLAELAGGLALPERLIP